MSSRKIRIVKEGQRIKQIRTLTGLTQEEFGTRVGCSGENISRIEKGVHGPSRAIELNICHEFGVSEKWLLEGGGPRYTEDVAREKSAEYGVRAPKELPEDIPVIGEAEAGSGAFTPDGYPTGEEYKRMRRPYDVRDRQAFAVEVKGESMAPRYEPGEIVVCSPQKAWRSGDYCVVITTDGAVLVKKVHERNHSLILSSLAPSHDPIVLAKERLRAVHRIVWKKERS